MNTRYTRAMDDVVFRLRGRLRVPVFLGALDSRKQPSTDDPFVSDTMGVSHAIDILYSVEGLSLKHVVAAAHVQVEINCRGRQIAVVLDANWLGMKSGRRDEVEYTTDVVKLLLGAKFRVVVVFSPKQRYHLKAASIQRSGRWERDGNNFSSISASSPS